MDRHAFMETWFRRVWAEKDLDAINQMMAPDVQVYGTEKRPHASPDEFRAFAEAFLKLVSDVEITIPQYLEDGEWVSVLMKINATSLDGKHAEFFGCAMARISDGYIREGYNFVDFIEFYEQIGLLSEDTMAQCLSGKRVG